MLYFSGRVEPASYGSYDPTKRFPAYFGFHAHGICRKWSKRGYTLSRPDVRVRLDLTACLKTRGSHCRLDQGDIIGGRLWTMDLDNPNVQYPDVCKADGMQSTQHAQAEVATYYQRAVRDTPCDCHTFHQCTPPATVGTAAAPRSGRSIEWLPIECCSIGYCRCSDPHHALPSSQTSLEVATVERYIAARRAELAHQCHQRLEAEKLRETMRAAERSAKKSRDAKASARRRARSELPAMDALIARGSDFITPRFLAQREQYLQLLETDAVNDSTISRVSASESDDDSR